MCDRDFNPSEPSSRLFWRPAPTTAHLSAIASSLAKNGADRRATPFRTVLGQQTGGSRSLSLNNDSPREWRSAGDVRPAQSNTNRRPRYLGVQTKNGGRGDNCNLAARLMKPPSALAVPTVVPEVVATSRIDRLRVGCPSKLWLEHRKNFSTKSGRHQRPTDL